MRSHNSSFANLPINIKITVENGAYQKAIAELKSDKNSCSLLKAVLSKKKKESEDYKTEKKLTVRPENDIPDTERINRELSEKRHEQTRLEASINDVENATEELEQKQSELKEAEASLLEMKHIHKLLDAAVKCLTKAD